MRREGEGDRRKTDESRGGKGGGRGKAGGRGRVGEEGGSRVAT